jgi:hypothetical protein
MNCQLGGLGKEEVMKHFQLHYSIFWERLKKVKKIKFEGSHGGRCEEFTKMEATYSYEISINVQRPTRRRIPEDGTLQHREHPGLQSNPGLHYDKMLSSYCQDSALHRMRAVRVARSGIAQSQP